MRCWNVAGAIYIHNPTQTVHLVYRRLSSGDPLGELLLSSSHSGYLTIGSLPGATGWFSNFLVSCHLAGGIHCTCCQIGAELPFIPGHHQYIDKKYPSVAKNNSSLFVSLRDSSTLSTSYHRVSCFSSPICGHLGWTAASATLRVSSTGSSVAILFPFY